MTDKLIRNWELTIGISDLYNLDLNQLAHLDVIGRVARNIRLQKMYPTDKWAASLRRFGDWLNDDPAPGGWAITILVIAALVFGSFSGAHYR